MHSCRETGGRRKKGKKKEEGKKDGGRNTRGENGKHVGNRLWHPVCHHFINNFS
jgi:hypothetical protein